MLSANMTNHTDYTAVDASFKKKLSNMFFLYSRYILKNGATFLPPTLLCSNSFETINYNVYLKKFSYQAFDKSPSLVTHHERVTEINYCCCLVQQYNLTKQEKLSFRVYTRTNRTYKLK